MEDTLGNDVSGLPSVDAESLPWKPIKMWLYQSSANMAMSFKDNYLTVDNSKNSAYYGNSYGPVL